MLREIAFHFDDNPKLSGDDSLLDARRLAYCVAELVCIHLPPSFSPDGLAKLNVHIASSDKTYWCVDRIGNIFIDSKLFGIMLDSPQLEQQASILTLLRDSMIEQLPINDAELVQLHDAVSLIVNSNFAIKTRLQKLSKIHPSRKLSIAINRIIDVRGETWTAEIWHGKYERFAECILLASDTHIFLASHEFRTSKWVNNGRILSLRNSQNRVSWRINVAPHLGNAT